jgi:hypothetical protein
MQDPAILEQRIAALERIVADLQKRLGGEPQIADWVKKIGTVKDVESFERAMEYGREFRYADRPPDEENPQP